MGGGAYERLLSEAGSRRREVTAAAGAWAALRRAARRLARAARQEIKAAPAPARAAKCGYDAASYARNFDDGAWKADEGVLWGDGRTAPPPPSLAVSAV